MRGLVERRLAERPAGSERATPELGAGTLRVVRQMRTRNYESRVSLVEGGVASNVVHFLEQSEQTPSAVMVGVLEGPEGVRAAGGMIVELMPDADAGTVARLESNLETLDGVSRWLEAGGTEALLFRILL